MFNREIFSKSSCSIYSLLYMYFYIYLVNIACCCLFSNIYCVMNKIIKDKEMLLDFTQSVKCLKWRKFKLSEWIYFAWQWEAIIGILSAWKSNAIKNNEKVMVLTYFVLVCISSTRSRNSTSLFLSQNLSTE